MVKLWKLPLMAFKDRRKKYDGMREIKRASFHKIKDADIITYIKDKEFSTYVKKLIREDMRK